MAATRGLHGGGASPSAGKLVRRPLGRTGETLSIIGLGGMALAREPQEEVNRLVREAFECGVNYFDVAPTYGNAQDVLGPALKPYREKSFLACKTQARDRKGAEDELHASLEKLMTDHVDLYQFHALNKVEDVEKILGPDGAMETFLKAREDGKIRFIGFSAHSSEAAVEAMSRFDFDTVLFPINYVCVFNAGFGPAVIKKAREKKMGILAIKAMAKTPWPKDSRREGCAKCWYQPVTDPAEAGLALRYTLSQPVTAAVPPGDPGIFRRALQTALSFTPIGKAEESDLRRMAAPVKPLFELHPPVA